MTESEPSRRRLETKLDELLEKAVERGRYVRHGLLAVARVDGTWSWRGAHGVIDAAGTPAGTDARYPIASVTKLFTAVVTLRQVEQGRLALDDRMVDFLEPDLTAGLHVLDGVDHSGRITVEHLLSHTSGLPDYYGEAPRGGISAESRLLGGEDAPMPFEEVLEVVRQLTPHFPPQALDSARVKARYADTNYQLLGKIIEEVAGQPLTEVFDTFLFRPLGLDDTSSYPHPPRSGASPQPEADIWAKNVVLRPEGALRHQVADGGIISTLSDQCTFMRALVTGGIFEEHDTWPRMCRRFNRVFYPVEYGLGVMRYAPPRWMSPFFAVPTLIGHTGSTATWLFHCPGLEVVLAGAFNVAQPPLPFRFLPRVLRAVSSAPS